jgi:DNA polymerase III epsilon subunit-like protein
MLDLETLGTRPGCAILSIGAVAFDPPTMALGPAFYTVVNRQSCRAVGLHENTTTIAWWSRRSEEAREVLTEVDSVAAPTIGDTLEMFATFVRPFSGKCRVWGCGSDFDNAILAHIYAVTGRPLPWRYTNNRCYRTLKNLVKQVPLQRAGTHHNALDDARSQALHAMDMLALLSRAYRQ